MTTCPDCGTVIHDNVLHLCLAGTLPPSGYLDFLLDDGRHVVYSIDNVLAWSDGDTSSIQPGDERMAIMLLAKVAKLSLQLTPSPTK